MCTLAVNDYHPAPAIPFPLPSCATATETACATAATATHSPPAVHARAGRPVHSSWPRKTVKPTPKKVLLPPRKKWQKEKSCREHKRATGIGRLLVWWSLRRGLAWTSGADTTAGSGQPQCVTPHDAITRTRHHSSTRRLAATGGPTLRYGHTNTGFRRD